MNAVIEKTPEVTEELMEQYQRDGVMILRQVLSPSWLELIELGVSRNLKNPGPHGLQSWQDLGESGSFRAQAGDYWQDFCNFETIPEYRRALYDSPIADIAVTVFGCEDVWLYFEQIFVKQGPSRRTPWHQDSPYLEVEGEQVLNLWIPLDDVDGEEALEFVSGSHRGFTSDEANASKPFNKGFTLPGVPDIEKERDKWPIVRMTAQRGDVVVFHPDILHGGGIVPEGKQRRTFGVKLYGPEARYRQRPGLPMFPALEESLQTGDLLRHPYFPKLRPRPEM